MPFPFNKQLDLKLIKLVKAHPIIYDTGDPKYLDFDTRELIWQKIGDELGRPAAMCKSRWVNIRDMMRRKVRERLKNPNQRHYNYKYQDMLEFMLPYFKDGPSKSLHEEYELFEDDATPSEATAEVFIESIEYQKDVKPNLSSMTSKKNEESFSDSFQDTSDPVDVFLMTIGTSLKKFTPYYLNQAKSKIFQVVQDYELEQIVNNGEIPPAAAENR